MRLIYKKSTRTFATYGDGPHHCIVCIKDSKGNWTSNIEEGEYAVVKELYDNQYRKKADTTCKVFKLD